MEWQTVKNSLFAQNISADKHRIITISMILINHCIPETDCDCWSFSIEKYHLNPKYYTCVHVQLYVP